jgi:hypothetical protein
VLLSAKNNWVATGCDHSAVNGASYERVTIAYSLFKLIKTLLNFRFVHMAEVYHKIKMQNVEV